MQKNRISNDLMLIIMTSVFTCGTGALCMGFLPGVSLAYESSDTILDGFNCLFLISPLVSILMILGYSLPLISFVVSYQGAKRKHHKVLFFVASGLALIGAVLILLEPTIIMNALNDATIIEANYCSGPVLGFLFALATALITLITGLVRN